MLIHLTDPTLFRVASCLSCRSAVVAIPGADPGSPELLLDPSVPERRELWAAWPSLGLAFAPGGHEHSAKGHDCGAIGPGAGAATPGGWHRAWPSSSPRRGGGG